MDIILGSLYYEFNFIQFGGNLVSFDGSLKTIQINKTVIEPNLLLWSEHLREILNNGNYEEFCHRKSELTPDKDLQLVWIFLKTMFLSNSKEEQLKMLGYSTEKVFNTSQFHNNTNKVEKNFNENKVIEYQNIIL